MTSFSGVTGRLLLSGVVALASSWTACGSSRGPRAARDGGPAAGGTDGSTGGASGARGGSAGFAGKPLLEAPVGGEGGASDCRRDVSFAGVVVEEPEPFDLVIVADHSDSLAWSRDALASGLADLLTNVQGRSVRVFVLTPTQYGASSARARVPITGESVVPWQDPLTDAGFPDAVTTYEQTCTDPAGDVIACPDPLGPDPYRADGRWSFVLPAPVAELRPGMTASQFQEQQRAVTEYILAIGGTGSPQEQPLCTLSRYMTQSAAALPQNAVFLLISDEDDTSVPDDCLEGFTGELIVKNEEQSSSPCTANCDVYRYRATGTYAAKSLPYSCAAFDDLGEAIPGSERTSRVNQGSLPTCDGFTAGPCTEQEKSQAAAFCESGKVLTACTRECNPTERTCSVDLEDPAVNPCVEPFVVDGKTYADLAEFCAARGSDWHDCRGGGLDVEYASSLSGTVDRRPLMSGTDTADVGAFFRERADVAFSRNGYLVEAIVLDASFSCPLGTGQSFATNIAAFVGNRSRLFPLCETYAPALEGVLDYARALIQTVFSLSLKEDEHVTAVVVRDRDGNERQLATDQFAFDAATMTLGVAPDALHGDDAELAVEVTSDCRPVVR